MTAEKKQEDQLFVSDKIKWMLDGGLEAMDAGERQMLLVMAETRLQSGYVPTEEEKRVIERLCDLAGEDYDAQEIKDKVHKMVTGRKKPDTAPLHLPPMFDQLRQRMRRK